MFNLIFSKRGLGSKIKERYIYPSGVISAASFNLSSLNEEIDFGSTFKQPGVCSARERRAYE